MKSTTDLHWSQRAETEVDDRKVNIEDLPQRQLENAFIFKHLTPSARVLEVGCGNGYLTQELREHVGFVDAFDYSEEMIARAQRFIGETNNRFFHDSILGPKHTVPPYDQVVCVRVLINLRDLSEQLRAIEHMHRLLGNGGRLILIEGFAEGFDRINALRTQIGLEPLAPAVINFYSKMADVRPVLAKLFHIEDEMHSGMFDLLTRVVYPLLVGAAKATGPSEFHEKIVPLAKAFNPDAVAPLARLRGLVLRKT